MQPLTPFFDSLRPPIEPQLLVEFTTLYPGETLYEIGCGNGYMALRLATLYPSIKEMYAIDLNPERILEAQQAYAQLSKLTPLPPIRFSASDARDWSPPIAVDVIVCNPPFFSQSASRPSPNAARSVARRDETLSLEELFRSARRILTDKGRMNIVFLYQRFGEVEKLAQQYHFQICKQQHHAEIRKRDGGIMLVSFKSEKQIPLRIS